MSSLQAVFCCLSETLFILLYNIMCVYSQMEATGDSDPILYVLHLYFCPCGCSVGRRDK